jgi:predicted O-methyltransferase YrrM
MLRYLRQKLLLPIITSKLAIKFVGMILNLKANKAKSNEELVKIATTFSKKVPHKLYEITPVQYKYEILNLLAIVREIKPKTVLEIGTACGGTLFLHARTANDHALIISVDLPEGKFGGGYARWRRPYYRGFAHAHQKIVLLQKNSHDAKTFEEIKKILNGRMIDYAFIDGDHTYEGVKRDYEMYSPLVRSGGIMAFHDICENIIGDPSCQVKIFWNEIRENFKHVEFLKNQERPGLGIGVLFL